MKHMPNNLEDILSEAISGFHQYDLAAPPRLTYVSQSLCRMVGYTEAELLGGGGNRYEALVHPADHALYAAFLDRLQSAEQTLSAEYRLTRKDGSVLYVKDTMTSRRLDDGTIAGYSVLSDITELKNENNNLQFLNKTISFGFIRYTCEKQPRVTYINQQMLEFLRIPAAQDGEIDYLEMYRDNIFLMIPIEERHRFALYLNRVYTAGTPIAGEIEVLRCDGTRAYLFGWVTKCVDEQGAEVFQSVCMDVTARRQAKRANEAKRYLKALTEVYDKIFEYDLSRNTVNCLNSHNSPMFKWLENIPMQMEKATEKWVSETVVPEDRERVRAFFHAFRQKKLYGPSEIPSQITYKAKSSTGEIKTYSGIFLKMNDSVSFFCCRRVPDLEEAELLRNENVSLKENMQELVMRFKEGIAAFEIAGEYVTPLYASDNVCEFFGFTKEEWLPLMRQKTPIKDFVSRSKTAYEDFSELLRTGEAEFTYYDFGIEGDRRIKAICSPKSPNASPRYVLLYNVDDGTMISVHHLDGGRAVSIRTFGYFDVFVGGKPIAFRSQKAKELFALLVDRRGGYVSSEEAISFLWEDEPINSVTLARYRKVALRLKNILEEYGIADVIASVDGKRRIVMEKVQCDLYDYLSGKEEYAQLFKGSYLSNYSWSETTLGELTNARLSQNSTPAL